MTEIEKIPKYNPEALANRESIANLSPLERVKRRGYRSYIGAHNAEDWYSIGRLQYFFLVNQGLKPEHNFLDLGCGSLRLGQFLIPYLNKEKYFGLEPEEVLVQCGLKYELPDFLVQKKFPTFSHNYEFKFEKMHSFDYAIANSIFTHLTPQDITLCFKNLFRKTNASSRFYFTFFEGGSENNPKSGSHANRSWRYSMEELIACADNWTLNYIGKWNHPRNQMIVKAMPNLK